MARRVARRVCGEQGEEWLVAHTAPPGLAAPAALSSGEGMRARAAAPASGDAEGGAALLDEVQQGAVIAELEAAAARQRRWAGDGAALACRVGAAAYLASAAASAAAPLERARDARLGARGSASCWHFAAADVVAALCLLCAAWLVAQQERQQLVRALALALASALALFWAALLHEEHTQGLPAFALWWLPLAPAAAVGVAAWIKSELAWTRGELDKLKSLRYGKSC